MSSPLSKTEKEKQKLIQEKCQTILAAMLRDEDNKYCVDCDAKGPRWASWNLGIFLCIRCAGIHRNLGVHISRVKSVNLDSWTPEQVVSLQQMGNSRARAVYEANLPDNFRRPQTDASLESFIRAKYEAKKYIAKEWVCPPPVKISWDAEIELELKRKKEAKRKLNGSPAASNSVDLPSSSPRLRPNETSSNTSSSSSSKEISQPTAEVTLPAPSKPSSASQDLLGLDVVVNESTTGNDLFGGLLSTTGSTTNGNATGNTSKNADEDNFFNQKAPSATEKRTLDKNSILALYNQGGTTGTAPTLSTMPNMFAAQGVYGAAQPAFGPTPVMNQAPGLMAGGFAPLVQGNMYASPMYPAAGGAPAGTATMTQLSQQMGGLNFGTAHGGIMPTAGAAAPLVPGMMMGAPAPMPMAVNPTMAATGASPFMFMPTGGMNPMGAGQQPQQLQQQQSTLSTNLWQ